MIFLHHFSTFARTGYSTNLLTKVVLGHLLPIQCHRLVFGEDAVFEAEPSEIFAMVLYLRHEKMKPIEIMVSQIKLRFSR